MPDKIQLDIDIINMRFGYLDTDTVSDIEYPDSDTDRLNLSKRIRSRIRSENIRTIFIPGSACAFAQDALHLLHFILLFGLLLVSKLLLAIFSAVIPQFLYYILSFLKHITI
jgi:hypothetical protein